MLRIWMAVALVVVTTGCERRKPPPPSAPPPGTVDTATGDAAAAPSTPTTPTPTPTADASTPGPAAPDAAIPTGFLPPRLGPKEGTIFAETAGGSVQGIPDGTRVALVAAKQMGVGDAVEGAVTIEHAGKVRTLPPERVLVEDALKRSPDGAYAVFGPIVACGDFCHTVLWLVGRDGRRVKLGDGGVQITPAWPIKGHTLAVGSANLYVVSLVDFKPTFLQPYTSPAYGPDGTLYVRGQDGSAFTLVGTKGTRVWKAPKKKDDGDDSDPSPVTFENGKPKFELRW